MQNINKVKLESQESVSRDYTMYNLTKRLFDIISATLALIIFSPIFIVITIWVKLDSKGPAFFAHKRLGKDRKHFGIYKFRSMVINAKEVFENFTPEQKAEFAKNFKLDNDPRITKAGDFLRRTSLDELPQLINIIKGEMSVVGPRPIIDAEIEKYGEFADALFSVKPGLTGYWQANGRSDTSYEERVEMDMYYINNRTFWLDIKIIFRTVISVIKKEGAM